MTIAVVLRERSDESSPYMEWRASLGDNADLKVLLYIEAYFQAILRNRSRSMNSVAVTAAAA